MKNTYAIYIYICAYKTHTHTHTYIYIYIYIEREVLFGPVKPELGVIPSGQENHSRAEHLNLPGRELNVINFTEQYFHLLNTKSSFQVHVRV